MNNKLYEFLKHEEKQSFKGWDFSYLDKRWEDESLPWDYRQVVKSYLKDDDNLLDMGTGGGEFLLTLNHPYDKTSVTEGYKPNYDLCIKKLAPLGITVKSVDEADNLLDFEDDTFDIVINRHESFSFAEVKRVLKPNGIFITQQVGDRNNYSLSNNLLKGYVPECEGWNLSNVLKDFAEYDFEVLYNNEAFPYLRFFDAGAICYYAKIIEWEFPDFSVDKCYKQLEEYQRECEQKGYVQTHEHRFVVTARNEK